MDTVISLIELALYIAGILALSMVLTWAVIRISPSEAAKELVKRLRDEARAL